MIDILFMLESYFDSLEWKFSACWSILAKNHIISLKKCMFMIDALFMIEYCFDELEWKFSACWSILAKNHTISWKKMYAGLPNCRGLLTCRGLRNCRGLLISPDKKLARPAQAT